MSAENGCPGGDDERQPPGREGSPEGAWPDRFSIPDDASGLEADRQRWLAEVAQHQRELRRARTRARLRGLVLTRQWERYGLSGPLVVIVLLAVVLVGGLALGLGPRISPRPVAAPLASPSVPPGVAGGLLPDTTVRTAAGMTRDVRRIRPGVIALAPAGCDCPQLLREAFDQARGFALRMWLVAPPDLLPEMLRLSRDAGNGGSGVVEDVDGVLATAYDAEGVTLLLVHSDGVVAEVLRDVHTPLRLEPHLSGLPSPAAA